jgi:hypothetical protein
VKSRVLLTIRLQIFLPYFRTRKTTSFEKNYYNDFRLPYTENKWKHDSFRVLVIKYHSFCFVTEWRS